VHWRRGRAEQPNNHIGMTTGRNIGVIFVGRSSYKTLRRAMIPSISFTRSLFESRFECLFEPLLRL
jgi:hypothetical protein